MVPLDEKNEIESIHAFHRQIQSLALAGIKFDLGLPSSQQETSSIAVLHQRFDNWHLGAGLNRDRGVLNAYLATVPLPTPYRQALELWVRGEQATALDVLALPLSSQRVKGRSLGFLRLQTTFILTAVFLTLVGVCFYLVPIFTGLQEQAFRPAGLGLQKLQWMRAWLPVWGIAIPVMFALFLILQRTFHRHICFWTRPSTDASFALAEVRGVLSAPVRSPILANLAILLCGFGVMLVVYGVYGTTIELLINLLSVGSSR
jgi:hypothetical protein